MTAYTAVKRIPGWISRALHNSSKEAKSFQVPCARLFASFNSVSSIPDGPSPLHKQSYRGGASMRRAHSTKPCSIDNFKHAMRAIPTPIGIITTAATDSEGERGGTLGSVTSLTTSPALLTFNISPESRIGRTLQRKPYFAINILGEQGSNLATHFALPNLTSSEQFAACAVHRLSEYSNVPVLPDAMVSFICKVYDTFHVHDKAIVVAEVLSLYDDTASALLGDTRGTFAKPMVYHDRAYHRLTRLPRGDENE